MKGMLWTAAIAAVVIAIVGNVAPIRSALFPATPRIG